MLHEQSLQAAAGASQEARCLGCCLNYDVLKKWVWQVKQAHMAVLPMPPDFCAATQADVFISSSGMQIRALKTF